MMGLSFSRPKKKPVIEAPSTIIYNKEEEKKALLDFCHKGADKRYKDKYNIEPFIDMMQKLIILMVKNKPKHEDIIELKNNILKAAKEDPDGKIFHDKYGDAGRTQTERKEKIESIDKEIITMKEEIVVLSSSKDEFYLKEKAKKEQMLENKMKELQSLEDKYRFTRHGGGLWILHAAAPESFLAVGLKKEELCPSTDPAVISSFNADVQYTVIEALSRLENQLKPTKGFKKKR
jgi:hypothetical protein